MARVLLVDKNDESTIYGYIYVSDPSVYVEDIKEELNWIKSELARRGDDWNIENIQNELLDGWEFIEMDDEQIYHI